MRLPAPRGGGFVTPGWGKVGLCGTRLPAGAAVPALAGTVGLCFRLPAGAAALPSSEGRRRKPEPARDKPQKALTSQALPRGLHVM